jgi:hypothetical protein
MQTAGGNQGWELGLQHLAMQLLHLQHRMVLATLRL